MNIYLTSGDTLQVTYRINELGIEGRVNIIATGPCSFETPSGLMGRQWELEGPNGPFGIRMAILQWLRRRFYHGYPMISYKVLPK